MRNKAGAPTTRIAIKPAPVAQSLTDGASGGRSPLRQSGRAPRQGARRVAPNPPKDASPASWSPPGAPFPDGETEKGKPACPAPIKEQGRWSVGFFLVIPGRE